MKILAMSNFIPEEICDTVRFTQYSGERNISHYCGYASDFISQALQDNSVDGIVFPKTCDSTRIIGSYLEMSNKFLYQSHIPSILSLISGGGASYFASEIKQYKEAIERFFNISISDEQIQNRIDLLNQRNSKLCNLYENIEQFSYSQYLKLIHETLQKPLSEQEIIPERLRESKVGKRIFLIGSFLSNLKILDVIENNGLQVIGDFLPESGRLVSKKDVAAAAATDIYTEIAQNILSQKPSPSQNCYKEVLTSIFDEIRHKNVQGVIFITQQYCEAYDYLYYAIKKSMNIPMIQVALNGTDDDGKASIILEAFADMI